MTTRYSVPSHLGPIPLEFVPQLRDESAYLLGQWCPDKRVIKICKDLHPSVELTTVWHEWVHAMLQDIGIPLTDETEEMVCNTLGLALARFVQFKPHTNKKVSHAQSPSAP